MDYRRVYWLLFLGAGALFGALRYLDYAQTGRVTTWTAITAGVAVLVVVTSAVAAMAPERSGGPTEPNVRFAIAAGTFVLMLWLVVRRLLGA